MNIENQPEQSTYDQSTYDPNPLLDTLKKKLKLKNDAALARQLEVAPPVISKIRHRTLRVGATLLLRMHEASELTIRDMRRLMGEPPTGHKH